MIITEIQLTINRKSDIETVRERLVAAKLQCPVYFLEYESSIDVRLASEYEEWELEQSLAEAFPGYHFTSDIENGRKEVRMILSRYQSPLSTDGWGRQIESPLDQVKYLVKISKRKEERFNPEVKVLFGDETVSYYVHMVEGVNRNTQERGYLLLNDFYSRDPDNETEVLKDYLYPGHLEAFHWGIEKMKPLVDQDFEGYLARKKKEKQEAEKLPRKLIRNFIQACNVSDCNGVLGYVDDEIIFEKNKFSPNIVRSKGKVAFEKLIRGIGQDLCGQGFKIGSSWRFAQDGWIEIRPKSVLIPRSDSSPTGRGYVYRNFRFRINDGKITHIVET